MKYAKNTKKKILLHVPQTGMTIPATLICGRETGKTITVSAGVHSREYIGIAALHRVGEDAAQTAVDTFYRRFGERLSVGFVFLFAQLCIEAAEVFRPQIDQLVAAEIRFEAFNILLLAHERGLCQFVRSNGLQPDFRVLFQRNRPVNIRI